MKGRVLIKTPDRAQRLSIYWRHNQPDFEILLNASLGTAVARLVSEKGNHYLDLPGEPRQYAASPADLLENATGLTIPFPQIAAMLSGDAAPSNLAGWDIQVTERDDNDRPRRIDATSLIDQQPVSIRLVVSEWQ